MVLDFYRLPVFDVFWHTPEPPGRIVTKLS